MTLVFYISGHGLGHASRDLEVINTVLDRRPGVRVVVRSSAPQWFFETFARRGVELQLVEVDTGVTQVDSLHLDEDDTARRAARFYCAFTDHVEAEAVVLNALGASAVVADTPPLGIAAAARAGVPSVALGNFTWDWIYGAYPEFERLAPGAIDVIRGAYARATRALRLPLHGGFEPMAHATEDVPLIARRAAHRRQDTRRALGLEDDAVVVLASFGGYGLALPYEDIACRNRFTLVVTDREMVLEPDRPTFVGSDSSRTSRDASVTPDGQLRRLEVGVLARRGLNYPDLVAAADVVVSKPGYGIVSECIANGAALLYTDRGRFPEHDIFVAEMPRVLRCRFMSQEDLLAGRWSDAVDALLGQPPPPERLPTDGADVAANVILEIADRRSNFRLPID